MKCENDTLGCFMGECLRHTNINTLFKICMCEKGYTGARCQMTDFSPLPMTTTKDNEYYYSFICLISCLLIVITLFICLFSYHLNKIVIKNKHTLEIKDDCNSTIQL